MCTPEGSVQRCQGYPKLIISFYDEPNPAKDCLRILQILFAFYIVCSLNRESLIHLTATDTHDATFTGSVGTNGRSSDDASDDTGADNPLTSAFLCCQTAKDPQNAQFLLLSKAA